MFILSLPDGDGASGVRVDQPATFVHPAPVQTALGEVVGKLDFELYSDMCAAASLLRPLIVGASG